MGCGPETACSPFLYGVLGEDMEYSCSLASAQAFAAGDRLEEWVHAYLLSHGNNRAFSEGLRRCLRCFMGPFRLPLGWFTRCCGPEPGMKYPVGALTRLGAAECSVIVWCTGGGRPQGLSCRIRPV